MINLDIGKLCFEMERPLNSDQSHLFRGYIAKLFGNNELVHNRNLHSGKCHYQYPVLQYKIVYGMPIILAIGEQALQVFQAIFSQVRDIQLGKQKLSVNSSAFQINEEVVGATPDFRHYQFLTPWIALNSKNYVKYRQANATEQKQILSRCLIGNMLSFAKFFDYRIATHLKVNHHLQSEPVVLKGETMLGFRGVFSINFQLPDLIGVGKSCSRGYGCVGVYN